MSDETREPQTFEDLWLMRATSNEWFDGQVRYKNVRNGSNPEVGAVDSVSWHVVPSSERVHIIKSKRWSGWSERLPGRTENQIYNKAYRLGIRGPSRNWTRREDEEVGMLLGMLEERMHRPRGAIASHMYLMTRGKAGKQWRR